MRDLGTFGGTGSQAAGINESGAVAGFAWYPGDHYGRAFVWSAGAGMQDIGALPGANHSSAYGINDACQVVGWGLDANGLPRAFLYSAGTISELPVFEGHATYANAINNHGQLACLYDWQAYHSFFYDPTTGVRAIGELPGHRWACAEDINDFGQVVGYSYRFGPLNDDRAFLWQDGTIVDLNELIPADSGWILRQARGINNRGQIVGTGLISGQWHAYVATPVPEPTTLVLLSAGLAGLAFLRTRRWGQP